MVAQVFNLCQPLPPTAIVSAPPCPAGRLREQTSCYIHACGDSADFAVAERRYHAYNQWVMNGAANMFRFDCMKALQATGILLQEPGKDRDNYLKVIKLLYIAEKESLLETGRPIIGDRPFALPHGPILSHVYDVIKGEDPRPEWSRFITTDDLSLRLLADPGVERLCRYEIDKLKEVAHRYREMDRWQMRDATHHLPEWIRNNPGQSSRVIPLRDIFEAAGKSEMLEAVQRRAAADRHFSAAFGV